MSSHAKPSLTTPTSDVESSPWLRGTLELRGGKKGDILKLVSVWRTLQWQPLVSSPLPPQGMLLLCLAEGKLDISYPPAIPQDLPDPLRDFLAK